MEETLHTYDINNPASYFAHYLCDLAKGIIRKHKPNLDTRLPRLESRMDLNSDSEKKWCALFDIDPRLAAPLTRYIPTSSQAIIEYVKRLNVSYKNLVFAASRIDFLQHDIASSTDSDIHLRYRYHGSEALNRTSSVARFSTEVVSDPLCPMIRQTDYFYLRHATCNTPINDSAIRTIRSMPRKRQHLCEQECIGEFYIWKRMGLDFGKLSGDLNLTHILDSTARITNKSRGFIQGLCTLNIIIGLLWQQYPQGLGSLNIYFSRPVLHEQRVYLLCDGNAFELIGEEGQMLAFGEIDRLVVPIVEQVMPRRDRQFVLENAA